MRFSSATALFTRQLAADDRSGHTRAAYARDLRAFEAWLEADPDLSAVTPDILARFLTSDQALLTPDCRPRKPISVNRTKSALRAFFAFCLQSGFIKDNPARLIRSSPASAKEPSTLTEEEIGRIREVLASKTGAFASRDRLIFEMLLGTGIRLGSLTGLNRGDVDLQSGVIQILAKGGHRERVFLNPALQALLAQHLGETASQGTTAPNSPLFLSKSGRRLGARQIQLNFGRWAEGAGIARSVSVHSLRHTFACRLYRKTGDLYLVQRALGHRQITTTEIYACVSDDVLRQAVTAA
jgi:integrase/recombinase XerC